MLPVEAKAPASCDLSDFDQKPRHCAGQGVSVGCALFETEGTSKEI
jgi:hypothetical protein